MFYKLMKVGALGRQWGQSPGCACGEGQGLRRLGPTDVGPQTWRTLSAMQRSEVLSES